MNKRRAEWLICILSIAAAIVALLVGAKLGPGDSRPLMIAAGLMGLSLWLAIGMYPRPK